MDCQDFVARYSEYLDEFMDVDDSEQMQLHLEACARCVRYDQVMRRGLDLARAVPAIGPSTDFQMRLEHRLMHVRDEVGSDGRMLNSGAGVSLALACLLALAAWGPLLSGERRTAGVALESAAPAAQGAVRPAATRSSIADDGWWQIATTVTPTLAPTFTPLAHGIGGAFPGPYSPLVISPPAVHYGGDDGGRMMLMSLPGID
jgi:hypothetical protein